MSKKRYIKDFRQEEIDALNVLISAAGLRKDDLYTQRYLSCKENAEYHLIDNAQEIVQNMIKEAEVVK